MQYRDLRDFIEALKAINELKTVSQNVSPILEMTEIASRVLANQGPAVIFSNPTNFQMPVLTNLFGTTHRVALAMGKNTLEQLREFGHILAQLKQPRQPEHFKDFVSMTPLLKSLLNMRVKSVSKPVCQELIYEGNQVDLGMLPVQKCWPGDAGPLITWGLVVTKGPQKNRENLGIYRQQVIGQNKVIMRWLAHRGGALDFRDFCLANPGKPFPVAVAIGADPATMISAVTPIPDEISEFQFAGLLRSHRTEVATTINGELHVPARAEIILEGYIMPDATHPSGYEHALEGPFGDHTGYYNEQEYFPVLTINRMTMRENPIYLSTYTGRPPDEPATLGVALNELFIPILQMQFPEIVDFYLPSESCSYRLAIISIKKSYLGHAKRIMFGVWSFLRQFLYTKYIVVVDDDINIRNWNDVLWAIATRVDPVRDSVLIDNTPIDYLDFASPTPGLGSKLGIDATNKWPGETQRVWGKKMNMSSDIREKIDAIWNTLGL